MIQTKSNLYTVIKNEDLSHLTDTERQILGLLLSKINSVKPDRKYYVVNADEPYSHKVLETILDGEEAKGASYPELVERLLIKYIPVRFTHKENIPDEATNYISFSFTSYPLLGRIEQEITPAVDDIIRQLEELQATNWKLFNVERLRDTYSFQDVYTGRILYGRIKDNNMVL